MRLCLSFIGRHHAEFLESRSAQANPARRRPEVRVPSERANNFTSEAAGLQPVTDWCATGHSKLLSILDNRWQASGVVLARSRTEKVARRKQQNGTEERN